MQLTHKFVSNSLLALALLMQAAGAQSTLQELEQEITAMVEKLKPCVVTVSANRSLQTQSEDGSRKIIQLTNVGSGLVLNERYVVTKPSVVMGTDSITVTTVDGDTLTAQYIGIHDSLDIAILKVNMPLERSSSIKDAVSITPGSMVMILGNAMGTAPAVSIGFVNNVEQNGVIQLSAGLAAGSAGGALFNSEGNLVGLLANSQFNITRQYRGGPTFLTGNTLLAYPIQSIRQAAKETIAAENVDHGYLGVIAEDWPSRLGGAHIKHVTPQSPAEEYGLKTGDIILAVNEKKVTSVQRLAASIQKHQPGDDLEFRILRDNDYHNMKVELGSRPLNTAMVNVSIQSAQPKSSQPDLLKRIRRLEQEIQNIKKELQ